MGLSHTVSGDIASFRTPSRVPIESLKFHFLPKQEGSGDPSPTNVRLITGWTGLNGFKAKKNLINISDSNIIYSGLEQINGTFINTMEDGRDEVQIYLEGYKIKNGNYTLLSQLRVITGITATRHMALSFTVPSSCEDITHFCIKHNGNKRDFRVYFPVKLPVGASLCCSFDITGVDVKTVGGFSFNNVQLQVGSESSLEPYEGGKIPITFPSNGKNIVDWPTPDGFSANVDFFNGWNTNWISGPFRVDKSYVGKILTYSADIDNTAASRTSYLHVWTRDKNNNYVRIDIQSEVVDVGESKRVSVSMIVDNTWYDIYFGLSIGRGSIVSHPMVEWGDAATSYEPYTANNTFYGGYIDPVAGEIVAEYQELILGEDISPKINNRASSYNYVSSASGADGSAVIYFEMGWTSAQPQYGKYTCNYSKRSAAIMNKMKYNSYDATVIRYLAAEMNEGEFGFTKSTTTFDSDGDGMVYCVLTVPSTCTDLAEAREWLEQNPIKFYYPLKHPLHIPITTQDLKAFLDHNNFWSDANDITEVTYPIAESKDILATRKKAMEFDIGHRKKVRWNQLARDISTSHWRMYSSNALRGTISDGIAECYYVTNKQYQRYSASVTTINSISWDADHYYYASYMVKPTYDGKFGIEFARGKQIQGMANVNANEWKRACTKQKPQSTGFSGLYIPFPDPVGPIDEGYQVKAPFVVDLTLMFGAGNEPATQTEFERICELNGIDLTTYQPYDEGSDRWLIIP